MRKIPPFISITDFTSPDEVQAMLNVFQEAGGPSTGRKLGVGVMMSRNTLHGNPSSWTDVFPHARTIREIFFPDEDTLNVLHYADFHDESSYQDLALAAGYGGPHLHAMQLDMVWPDPRMIEQFHRAYPDIGIILQLNEPALNQVGHGDRRLIERLHRYGNHVSALILDQSMGRGKEMDASFITDLMQYIQRHMPDMHIVAAGGLGPEKMHLIRPILRHNLELSTDAQGRLRPSRDAHDPIAWHLAAQYLRDAIEEIQRARGLPAHR